MTRAHLHSESRGGASHALGGGVLLNVAFVLLELAAAAWAGSLALFADALHNLTDVFGLLLAWAAMRVERRAATARRTYGWQKTTVFAALANAFLITLMTGGMFWESLKRLWTPAPVAGGVVIAVALAGVLINGLTAVRLHRFSRRNLNLRGAFLHMAGDAGISLGVAVAGFALRLTGWTWIDPAAGMVVALFILAGGWHLLRESTDMALDAVPEHIDSLAVRDFLGSLPGVVAVHDLHIWPLSTTATALTAHLVKPEPAGDDELLRRIGRELIERFAIHHVTIQWERSDAATCPRAGHPGDAL